MYKVVSFLLIMLLASYSAYGSYTLCNKVLDGGGTKASSAHWKLMGSVGQPNIGVASNSHYTASLGYWASLKPEIGVEEKPELYKNPKVFSLFQNYPNPFVSVTTIRYAIPRNTQVSLKIYDITGRLIETLVNCSKETGYYTVKWDASDSPSGIYFIKFSAGDYLQTRKLILMR